jgi:GT2 family glycosyltransferase
MERLVTKPASMPVATIAITTFRRPDMLAEAVESALDQDFARPFEILIVDNDPESTVHAELERRLSGLQDATIRYVVNAENLGMFGNFNRAVELARSEWLTILNDDDLLDPDFLSLAFAELDRQPDADGLVCRKRFFDQRGSSAPGALPPAAPQQAARGGTLRSAARMLQNPETRGQFAAAIAHRLRFEWAYSARLSRRIRPNQLFWGAILGNGGGFIFRRRCVLELGGFQPEEFPSSDYWLFARFAARFHLRQHRAVAASIRKADNETAKPDTVRAAFRSASALQAVLTKEHAPKWWRRVAPYVMARDRLDFIQLWRAELSEKEVEQLIGSRLPAPRPRLLRLLQLFYRGF